MKPFDIFISEATAKAEQFGWGSNQVTVLPSKSIVRVVATQPIPEDTILVSYRINEQLTDRDTVMALLNGE